MQQPPAVGDSAPGFTATGIDGTPVLLGELRGKPVRLVFMATWCTGCRTEIPDIQGVVAFRGDAIRIVVVYVGESRNTVRDCSKRVGNDFPEVMDQDQQISAAYGIMGVPAHYFINAGGVVRQRHVGVLSPDAMTQAIQNAMSSLGPVAKALPGRSSGPPVTYSRDRRRVPIPARHGFCRCFTEPDPRHCP